MDGDEAAAAEQISSRAVNEPSGSLAVIGNMKQAPFTIKKEM